MNSKTRIWDWLIHYQAGEEDTILVSMGGDGQYLAQYGGSIAKDFAHGDLGKCPDGETAKAGVIILTSKKQVGNNVYKSE